MKIIANYKDNECFTTDETTVRDFPQKGITGLYVQLPFALKRTTPDGKVTELPKSVISFEDYEAYYFAFQAKGLLGVQGGSIAATEPVQTGACVAAIDYTRDFVNYVEIDKVGNVKMKVYTVDKFMEIYSPSKEDIKKGV